MIESEPDIRKVHPIHENWRMMISADDIAPVFPIIDAARDALMNHGGH